MVNILCPAVIKRNVSNYCIGYVAATHFFRKACRSRFSTTTQVTRCAGVGLRMCGEGNIAVGMSQ